jgi:hypothetical protein
MSTSRSLGWSRLRALGATFWAVAGIAVVLALSLVVILASLAATPSDPVVRVASAATATPTPTVVPVPVVTTKDELVLAEVPFAAVSQNDGNLLVGTNVVTVPGVNGVQTTTFRVSYTDGVETGRTQVSQVVTTTPVDQMTNVGVQPAPVVHAAPSGCDPNYGGCVPVASDVDCAGGSGNGPAYVEGIVQVIGSDIYDLDRDGDGYGCD